VPGVVGHVGTVLAMNGVNIANFSLGRAEQGSEPRQAIGVVRVDGTVPEHVVHQLRKLEAVDDARAIHLRVAGEERLAASAE